MQHALDPSLITCDEWRSLMVGLSFLSFMAQTGVSAGVRGREAEERRCSDVKGEQEMGLGVRDGQDLQTSPRKKKMCRSWKGCPGGAVFVQAARTARGRWGFEQPPLTRANQARVDHMVLSRVCPYLPKYALCTAPSWIRSREPAACSDPGLALGLDYCVTLLCPPSLS